MCAKWIVDVNKMPQTHKELKEWVITKSKENLPCLLMLKDVKILYLEDQYKTYKTNLAIYFFYGF